MSQTVIAVATIVAIVVGPLLALWIQRWADERREKRKEKLWVFKTLMMYRATVLNPAYVQALNIIDIVFNANNEEERSVRTAWKVLLDHLSSDQNAQAARDKAQELTGTLLVQMGKSLKYEFDPVYLKRQAYQPIWHNLIEEQQHEVRSLLLQVLKGNRRIGVAVFPDDFDKLRLPSSTDTK